MAPATQTEVRFLHKAGRKIGSSEYQLPSPFWDLEGQYSWPVMREQTQAGYVLGKTAATQDHWVPSRMGTAAYFRESNKNGGDNSDDGNGETTSYNVIHQLIIPHPHELRTITSSFCCLRLSPCTQPRLVWSSESYCLRPQSAGIIGGQHPRRSYHYPPLQMMKLSRNPRSSSRAMQGAGTTARTHSG